MLRPLLRIRNLLLSLLAFILIFLGINYKSLIYGLGQLKGQIEIMSQVRETEEVLKDPDFPDSLKTKLRLVEEIKNYAVDELGLRSNENYTTIYDQKGKDILWVVVACEAYELTEKQWSFPIAGSFPYKGYFDYDKAVNEQKLWKDAGLDTRIKTVSGWSTLGWFRDPILSNMLFRTEGQLANVIIHELTHGTVFIKDEVDLNENLATFIGDYGALYFLEEKYGTDSREVRDYKSSLDQAKVMSDYIKEGAAGLDSLYKSVAGLNISEKKNLKREFIRNWVDNIDLDTMPGYAYFKERYSDTLPNNTLFVSHLTYNEFQNQFELEYRSKYKDDFPKYLEFLISEYRSKENWYDFL